MGAESHRRAGDRHQARLILCAMPVLVGVVSYFFTAVKFKVITHEDCLLLPKGEKIAKILKL